jgi:hypothetical protein
MRILLVNLTSNPPRLLAHLADVDVAAGEGFLTPDGEPVELKHDNLSIVQNALSRHVRKRKQALFEGSVERPERRVYFKNSECDHRIHGTLASPIVVRMGPGLMMTTSRVRESQLAQAEA